MLILSRADVEAVLDRDALTDAVGSALAETSAGWASLPPRVAAETGAGLLLAIRWADGSRRPWPPRIPIAYAPRH